MEPDSAVYSSSDPETDPFLRQFARPLAYLRDLGRKASLLDLGAQNGAARRDAADGAGAKEPAPERPIQASASVLKKIEEVLGFAPALDLPSPEGASGTGVTLSDQRYSIEGELGTGGMGKVLLVYDQDIRRRVAMKFLREEVTDPNAVSRFLEEAQATGQLEHPNIAPVYDLGIDASGRVFFTMKLVRGRNLREILRDVAIGRIQTRQHFTQTRLIQILQQASMGVHYAHVRGVIHRDLKPENVMVGDFGEVLVMDWGLAKVAGRHLEGGVLDAPVESYRRAAGTETLDGTIQGTLAYMSPEQARGWVDEIDVRTDVFGLGGILYEILTYQPPYDGKTPAEVLDKASVGEVVPPRQRAPRNRIPASLERICMKALAPEKDDRYAEAKAFHEELQVFLDGRAEAERRAQEAVHLVRQGKDKAHDYRRLADVERKLRRESAGELAKCEPHDPAARKQAAWDREDEAARVRQQRIQAFNEATSLLHSAINVDESQNAAKEILAGLYWDRFQEAERSGNQDEMIIYRGLVERYHRGRYAEALEGKGLLQLQSDPPGVEATLHRVAEVGRRLQEGGGEVLGRTPLRLPLAMGHYLLVLRLSGYRDTRYPVLIERCGKLTAKVQLFRDEEVGEGMLYIPAGEVILGGDPAAPGALEATRRYVGGFFAGRHPVTFREYCAFLDALREAGDPELAQLIPHTEKEGECVVIGLDRRYRPVVEKLVDLPARRSQPEGFEWRLPVLAVSWFAAARYCEWLSRQSGREVRLLRDAEWEKAARGPARSAHPWGHTFDWSFAKGGLSRAGPPQPEPVESFEADVSIYGVRDLAGTIREWCADWFVDGVARLIRGGAWSSMNPVSFRSAVRSGARPGMKSSAVGFRIAATPARRVGLGLAEGEPVGRLPG